MASTGLLSENLQSICETSGFYTNNLLILDGNPCITFPDVKLGENYKKYKNY